MVLPPTSTGAFIETPRIAAAGEHRIDATASTVGAMFSAGVGSTTLAYSRGMGDGRELTISPIFQVYNDANGDVRDFKASYRYGYGADVRLKLRPFESEHVATFVGLGGVVNHYATFLAPSIGASLAYENDYVVPFVNAQAYLATPVASRDVIVLEDQTSGAIGPAPVRTVLHPSNTVGALVSLGVQLKIARVFSLKAAGTWGHVASETDDIGVGGIALGAGATF